jgi:hypothetical protein
MFHSGKVNEDDQRPLPPFSILFPKERSVTHKDVPTCVPWLREFFFLRKSTLKKRSQVLKVLALFETESGKFQT